MRGAPGRRFEALAALFRYPDAGLTARARRTAEELRECPDASAALERFARAVDGFTTGELQEEYTATFDFTESCALEIGWHIFGDRHERGAFMAGLREDLQRAHIEETHELPDHLTHVLHLLERDVEGALAARVSPAIDRLHAALTDRRSPYAHATEAVAALLASAATTKEPSR